MISLIIFLLVFSSVQAQPENVNFEEILKKINIAIESYSNNLTYNGMLNDQNNPDDKSKMDLKQSATRSNTTQLQRKTIIPSNWNKIDPNEDRFITTLPPGERIASLLDTDGDRIIKFVPDCQGQGECWLYIQGSKNFHCQTSVVCDKPLDFGENAADCSQNLFALLDRYQGLSLFCNGYDFKGQSYKARQQGRDILVVVKGQSKNTVCMAFCREDLFNSEDEPYGILYPTVIAKKTGELGYKEDHSCVCGIRRDLSARVVYGEDAKKNEFPWLAALIVEDEKNAHLDKVPICGGVLISDLHVITAAHCFCSFGVNPEIFKIMLNAYVVKKIKPSDGSTWTDEEVKSVPGWDLPDELSEGTIIADIAVIDFHQFNCKRVWAYDIAIITLAKKVNFGKGEIAPICLQRITEILNIKPNTMLTVAGWGGFEPVPPKSKPEENLRGKPNVRLLQKADIPFVNQTICNVQDLVEVPYHSLLCAGNTTAEMPKDVCQGDSGGPLIMKTNTGKNQYTLVGIVSFGAGCAQKGYFGYYTDIQEYLPWILHKTSRKNDATWCAR